MRVEREREREREKTWPVASRGLALVTEPTQRNMAAAMTLQRVGDDSSRSWPCAPLSEAHPVSSPSACRGSGSRVMMAGGVGSSLAASANNVVGHILY